MSESLLVFKLLVMVILFALLNHDYLYFIYFSNINFIKKIKKFSEKDNYDLLLSISNIHNIIDNANKIPVLTYHNIVNDSEKKEEKYKNDDLSVSKSIFCKQMEWLKNRGYRTINCEEFYLWYKGMIKLPKKTVFITFDDGLIGVLKNAFPILMKYNLKGTSFIIGNKIINNKRRFISYILMKNSKKIYPNLEFQSHTFNLHKEIKKGEYRKILRDAAIQNKYFDFEFLAYPYGKYTSEMIKAYKKIGIKMAFTYDKDNGQYATREQDIYKIKRIKVNALEPFSNFTRWFND